MSKQTGKKQSKTRKTYYCPWNYTINIFFSSFNFLAPSVVLPDIKDMIMFWLRTIKSNVSFSGGFPPLLRLNCRIGEKDHRTQEPHLKMARVYVNGYGNIMDLRVTFKVFCRQILIVFPRIWIHQTSMNVDRVTKIELVDRFRPESTSVCHASSGF